MLSYSVSRTQPFAQMRLTLKWLSLIAGFLALAATSPAQTFNLIYGIPNTSGAGRPEATLALGGNTLYGATTYGDVFKINTDGTGFANLHYFANPVAGAP